MEETFTLVTTILAIEKESMDNFDDCGVPIFLCIKNHRCVKWNYQLPKLINMIS